MKAIISLFCLCCILYTCKDIWGYVQTKVDIKPPVLTMKGK